MLKGRLTTCYLALEGFKILVDSGENFRRNKALHNGLKSDIVRPRKELS
jgi:hypothetical protein